MLALQVFRLLFVYVIAVSVPPATCARIYYEKCDYKGFTCTKSTEVLGKSDITFSCNTYTTYDIQIYLWQFRAPSTINHFKITNCTNVRLSLMCTNEGRNIQSLTISNVTKLTIDPIESGLAQSAPSMVFENIEDMGTIPSRTFLQIKKYSSKFGCAYVQKDLQSIMFKNVRIQETERESFHNLTQMSSFVFENVTIQRMHAVSAHLFFKKAGFLQISHSNFGILEYHSFFVRGDNFSFISNTVDEISSFAINATLYNFNFYNSTVNNMQCASLSVLARNVRIIDCVFNYIATGAFQAIGPGLPENSFMSFGKLKFSYEFKNNLIESLEVRSLQPDWAAYENVGSVVTVTYNALKCTCAELAWLGSKEGFGRDFSQLVHFHDLLLKKENNNICADAPCILPVDAVRLMVIKNGRCLHNLTLDYMCNKFYPSTTTTIPTVGSIKNLSRRINNTLPFYYKKVHSGAKKNNLISLSLLCLIYICSIF